MIPTIIPIKIQHIKTATTTPIINESELEDDELFWIFDFFGVDLIAEIGVDEMELVEVEVEDDSFVVDFVEDDKRDWDETGVVGEVENWEEDWVIDWDEVVAVVLVVFVVVVVDVEVGVVVGGQIQEEQVSSQVDPCWKLLRQYVQELPSFSK